jgi:hypothetical protein
MKEARLSKLVPSKTHFLKSSDSIKNAALTNETKRERESKKQNLNACFKNICILNFVVQQQQRCAFWDPRNAPSLTILQAM